MQYFLYQAQPPDEDTGLVEPGHVLKYSAYKNLASLAEKREQWEKSIDAYLQVTWLKQLLFHTLFCLANRNVKSFQDLFLVEKKNRGIQ